MKKVFNCPRIRINANVASTRLVNTFQLGELMANLVMGKMPDKPGNAREEAA